MRSEMTVFGLAQCFESTQRPRSQTACHLLLDSLRPRLQTARMLDMRTAYPLLRVPPLDSCSKHTHDAFLRGVSLFISLRQSIMRLGAPYASASRANIIVGDAVRLVSGTCCVALFPP